MINGRRATPDCPQDLRARRVPAAQGHLLRWRSSIDHDGCPASPLRRAALHLPLRRSERGLLYFHHGLLGGDGRFEARFMNSAQKSEFKSILWEDEQWN